MERVLYQLRCFPLQVKEHLTKNGLNNGCLLSHVTGSSEIGSFRAINSTKQQCSQESGLPICPLGKPQHSGFVFEPQWLQDGYQCSWHHILIQQHQRKGKFLFLSERKNVSKTPHPSTLPLSLTGQTWVSHCLLPPPLWNNYHDGENQSWPGGGAHLPWPHCGKTRGQSEGSVFMEGEWPLGRHTTMSL